MSNPTPPGPQYPSQPPYGQQPMVPGPGYAPPGYPPIPPQKKGMGTGSKIGIGIGGGVVALCLVAFLCSALLARGAAGSLSSSNNSNSSNSSNSSASQGPGKVGDTITVESVACTLVSAKTLQADAYVKPKAGNQFIVVHVKLKNNGSSEADYNVFDFHTKSSSGNITDPEVLTPSTYTANDELDSGKLSAGGSAEGDIVFQVAKGDAGAELTWQPSFFGNAGDNAWTLGL